MCGFRPRVCAISHARANTETRSSRTRGRKPHIPINHRIATLAMNSYGFVRSAVAPTARKSARMHTSERQKVCHFTLLAPQGGRQNVKRHTFASKKVCILALSRPAGATADLTKPYEFVAHLAILRFLGKRCFRPRVRAISHRAPYLLKCLVFL